METYNVEWAGPDRGKGYWVVIRSKIRKGRSEILLLLNGISVNESSRVMERGRLIADSKGVHMEKSYPLIHELVERYLRSKKDYRYVDAGHGMF